MKCIQNVYWEEYLHLKDSLYTDKKIILVLKPSELINIMMLYTLHCSLFPLHQVADFSYYTKGSQNFVLIINTFIKNFINFEVYLIGWLYLFTDSWLVYYSYSLIPDWLIILTHWFHQKLPLYSNSHCLYSTLSRIKKQFKTSQLESLSGLRMHNITSETQ